MDKPKPILKSYPMLSGENKTQKYYEINQMISYVYDKLLQRMNPSTIEPSIAMKDVDEILKELLAGLK